MQCLECGTEQERLENEQLLSCCCLTLHEYAMRHHTLLETRNPGGSAKLRQQIMGERQAGLCAAA